MTGYYLPAVEVVGDIGESLRALEASCKVRSPWMDDRARRRSLATLELHRADESFPMAPQRILADLRTALRSDDILISDVGAHKLWHATLFPAARPNSIIMGNGLASMGIAVPGAIAAKLVRPDRKIAGLLPSIRERESILRRMDRITGGRQPAIPVRRPDAAIARTFAVLGPLFRTRTGGITKQPATVHAV